MKILMIDAPLLFRDFLKNKLTAEKITVDFAQGRRDAFTKLLSSLPDLVLIDADKYLTGVVELMEKKHDNPNTVNIPTIITGPEISSDAVMDLMHLGVTRYFTKPVHFDSFFDTIAKLFRMQFSLDRTPCVLETHINGNVVFVEINQGLNRDKSALLKYNLHDLMTINNITTPKLVLLMSDLPLSFVDGYNLELLLNSVVSAPNLQLADIRILTLDSFTKELVAGHQEYAGIQVETSMITILNALVDSSASNEIGNLIAEKVLAPEALRDPCIVDLIFNEDYEERRQVIADYIKKM